MITRAPDVRPGRGEGRLTRQFQQVISAPAGPMGSACGTLRTDASVGVHPAHEEAGGAAEDPYRDYRDGTTRLTVVDRYGADLAKFGGKPYSIARSHEEKGFSLDRAIQLIDLAAAVYFTQPQWASARKEGMVTARRAAELSAPLQLRFGRGLVDLLGERAGEAPRPAMIIDSEYDQGEEGVSSCICRDGIVTNPDTDSCAQFLHNPERGELLLIFRGTDSRHDVLTDAKIWRKDWQVGDSTYSIHGGFLGAWLSLEEVVLAVLDSAWATGKYTKLFLAGHSLGGAVATLAAFRIHHSNKSAANSMRVYTVGSPLVGDSHFASMYDSSVQCTYRIVNDQDAVCCVPLPMFGYDHVGTEIFMNSRGIWIDPSPAVKKLNKDKWTLAELGSDHRTGDYVFLLERFRAEACFGEATLAAVRSVWEQFLEPTNTVVQMELLSDGGPGLAARRIRCPSYASLFESMASRFDVSKRLCEAALEECKMVMAYSLRTTIDVHTFVVALYHVAVTAAVHRTHILSRCLAREAFDKFDANGDGFLSHAELLRLLASLYGPSVSKDEVAVVFRELNTITPDFGISFEELSQYLGLWSSRSDLITERGASAEFTIPNAVWDVIASEDGNGLRAQCAYAPRDTDVAGVASSLLVG